jgi:hypothetical protein
MWWRFGAPDFRRLRGEGNKRAFRKVVGGDLPPGVLAYAGDEAVGWCAVAPRAAYTRLARSRIFQPIDAEPVWSVSCFFVAAPTAPRDDRHLLRAALLFAVARAHRQYPVGRDRVDPWTGSGVVLRAAGFVGRPAGLSAR